MTNEEARELRDRAPNDENAVSILREAAEAGDVHGQFYMGSIYHRGYGVDRDEALAASWCRKAAEQGLAPAQYVLGSQYATGQGVSRNLNEAAVWIRKAAEQDHVTAQLYLGLMYSNGEGVAQDWSEAATWFRKAAEQGNGRAQYELGSIYAHARGVIRDYKEAAIWIGKAAEQGLAPAQQVLADMCANGQGVPQDLNQAISLFLKHEEQCAALQQKDPVALEHFFGFPPIPDGIEIPNQFIYIRNKAFRYLAHGADKYRQQDALRLPPAEWPSDKLESLKRGCVQLVQWWGCSPELPLENIGIRGFYALMHMFHFKLMKQSIFSSGNGTITDKMEMVHIVTGEDVTLYNRVQANRDTNPC